MFPWASKKGKSTSNLEEDVGFPEEMSSGSERRLRALSGAGGGIPLEPPNLEPLPAATRSKRSGSMPFLMVAPPPLSQIAEGGGGDEGALPCFSRPRNLTRIVQSFHELRNSL